MVIWRAVFDARARFSVAYVRIVFVPADDHPTARDRGMTEARAEYPDCEIDLNGVEVSTAAARDRRLDLHVRTRQWEGFAARGKRGGAFCRMRASCS
jgi:hypothetical protein